MPLMEQLQPGEDVMARVGPFYATNRRVLRFDPAKGKAKEQLKEVAYGQVSGIELMRPPNHRLMAGGTAVAASGVLLLLTWGLYTSMLAIPAGVAMIVLGGNGAGMGRYFQIFSQGANRKEEALWRVPYYGSADFIAAVERLSGQKLRGGGYQG